MMRQFHEHYRTSCVTARRHTDVELTLFCSTDNNLPSGLTLKPCPLALPFGGRSRICSFIRRNSLCKKMQNVSVRDHRLSLAFAISANKKHGFQRTSQVLSVDQTKSHYFTACLCLLIRLMYYTESIQPYVSCM